MTQGEPEFDSRPRLFSRKPGKSWRRTGFVSLGLAAVAATLALSGCQTAAPEASVPTPPSPHHVVVIGDSLSTGLGTSAQAAWPSLINADSHDASDPLTVTNAAQNSSGYLRVGSKKSTFGSQVQENVTPDTALVLFFGSENDRGYDPKELTAAMTDAYKSAREKSPNATLLVVGPPAYSKQPEANRLAVRDAIQDAATATGSKFVDPISLGWIVDDVKDLVGPDGVHPSVAGHVDLRDKMEALIKESLPPQAPASAG